MKMKLLAMVMLLLMTVVSKPGRLAGALCHFGSLLRLTWPLLASSWPIDLNHPGHPQRQPALPRPLQRAQGSLTMPSSHRTHLESLIRVFETHLFRFMK